jgi:hypothetical protein
MAPQGQKRPLKPPTKSCAGERRWSPNIAFRGALVSGPGWGNGKVLAVLYAREGAKGAMVADLHVDAAA